ncbi:MAG: fibronectin type III domain-containing protein [Defluviitaleaceae bacterium]|nr:fibronectin type III domain-containing protein [Defluviitaleaceae bacterium]
MMIPYNTYAQGECDTTAIIQESQTQSVNVHKNRLSAGSRHSLHIKSNGSLWAWGRNSNGQLGDSTTIDRNLPTRIGTANNWVSAFAGNFHSVAINTDGELWAWGSNSSGELGIGTTTRSLVPIRIGVANNWVSIATGSNQSFAINSDNELWAWGINFDGRLGDGTTNNRHSPIKILPLTITPTPPTNIHTTPGDTQATISFTPPTDNGGSPITYFTVTAHPGGYMATGTASPITITGLTNGVEYTFTVTATNAIGASAPSEASNPVTPSDFGTNPPTGLPNIAIYITALASFVVLTIISWSYFTKNIRRR